MKFFQRIQKLRGRGIAEWEDEEYSDEALQFPILLIALQSAKDRYAECHQTLPVTTGTNAPQITQRPKSIRWRK